MSLKNLVVKSETVAGEVRWFREITGAERIELVKGQKISRQSGAAVFEVDLALNQEQQHKMVLFSVCNEDGSACFANLKAVQALSAKLIDKLFKIADAVNDEDEEESAKND